MCHRWKEYCEELYEENRQIDVQEKEPPPLKDEIRYALLKSAQRKATGLDGTAAELLRFGGEMTLNKLHEVCVEVWEIGLCRMNGRSQSSSHFPRKVIHFNAATTGVTR